MPPAGFEPTISAGEWPRTYDLDHVATGTGSMLITDPNNIQLQRDLNIVSGQLNKWFKVNLLSLNFEKTYFIQFTNKSTCTSDIQLCMKINTFIQLLKQNFLGYLLIIISLGKHTLTILSLN